MYTGIKRECTLKWPESLKKTRKIHIIPEVAGSLLHVCQVMLATTSEAITVTYNQCSCGCHLPDSIRFDIDTGSHWLSHGRHAGIHHCHIDILANLELDNKRKELGRRRRRRRGKKKTEVEEERINTRNKMRRRRRWRIRRRWKWRWRRRWRGGNQISLLSQSINYTQEFFKYIIWLRHLNICTKSGT